MTRLSKKIDNALNDDKADAILSEVEETNDILTEGDIAKEKTVDHINVSLGEVVKDIAIIKGDKGDPGDKGDIPKVGVDFELPKDGYTPIKGVDYFDGNDADEEKIVEDVLDQIPKPDDGKTPIKGEDYLTDTEMELIKTEVTPVRGEDYFTKEDIANLLKKATPKKGKDYFTKKEIKELLKKITPVKGRDYFDGVSRVAEGPFGGAGSNGQTDLSSQCDGATKVFTLDDKYRSGTVRLHCSQFPLIYRPTVDFTESGVKQITLTSEVNGPESGQTLMAFYERE